MAGDHRLPALSVLRAFEATVRHESVMRAARELHLTNGAISRAVRELESDLGFDLFKRGNRTIAPTAIARGLAEDIRSNLDALAGALNRAQRLSAPYRSLVLSCEPTFLIRWLIPRLTDLQAAIRPAGPGDEPDLRLISAGGVVPFARDGIDLAIRRTDFPIGADLVAEPFLTEQVGPVCRPDRVGELAGDGPIQAVLLHSATRPAAWKRWAQATGTPLGPTRELRFEHFYLSLQAAIAGAGVAIGPIALVADDIVAGSLVAPRGFIADETRYVLMAPRSGLDRAVFDRMLTWLRTAADRSVAEALAPCPRGQTE